MVVGKKKKKEVEAEIEIAYHCVTEQGVTDSWC